MDSAGPNAVFQLDDVGMSLTVQFQGREVRLSNHQTSSSCDESRIRPGEQLTALRNYFFLTNPELCF